MASNKFGVILIYDDEQFSQIFKDAEQEGVERGLILKAETNIGKQMVNMFDKVAKRGYFVSGFIVNGYNIEFLFQRHKNQLAEQKLTEIITPYKLKYKL